MKFNHCHLNLLIIACISFIISATSDNENLPSYILSIIQSGASQIIRKTNHDNNELLLFIGNSASYFYFGVEEKRPSMLVPFSSSEYIRANQTDPVKAKQALDHYSKVFIDPIIKKAREMGTTNIAAIDYIETGESIDAFLSILKQSCLDCNLSFIELTDGNDWYIKYFPDKLAGRLGKWHNQGKVLLPIDAEYIFDGEYTRLSPHMGMSDWQYSNATTVLKYWQRREVAHTIKLIKEAVKAYIVFSTIVNRILIVIMSNKIGL